MSVIAKFYCNNVTEYAGGYKNVILNPVTDDGDPENKAFWQASPSGELKLNINNPAASSYFSPGKYYYITFNEAPTKEVT